MLAGNEMLHRAPGLLKAHSELHGLSRLLSPHSGKRKISKAAQTSRGMNSGQAGSSHANFGAGVVAVLAAAISYPARADVPTGVAGPIGAESLSL